MIRDRQTWISGYRILWMIVAFDLPVVEKHQRKAATAFRNYLLDEGFHMAQFSVYLRLLDGRDAAAALERRLQQRVPDEGSVQVITITDKQYENIRVYRGRRAGRLEKQQQLALF